MRLGVFHGYSLSGTGSNIYVQNLVRELCRMGHDVSVMAQDREVSDLDFVNEFIRKGDRVSKQETSFDGYCKVYQPDIGDLLPCYVDYESDEYRTKPLPS